MNKLPMPLISAALISVLFFSATPLASAASVTTNANRCEKLAGREKQRCEFVVKLSARLKVRAMQRSETRASTMRQQRVITNNTSQSNIRRIGNYDLNRLRRHDLNGGRSRRLIQRRDEAARSACENLEGTEKYTCVRNNWRGLSRGNTR